MVPSSGGVLCSVCGAFINVHPELQIRGDIEDNSNKTFLISQWKLSLHVSMRWF